MNVDDLLMRFEMVKPSGADSWICNCPNPAHTRKVRRLAVTVKDGMILLHCFACSDTPTILRAAGLELGDLYPARIKDPTPQARAEAKNAFHRGAWAAALRVLSRESTIIEIASRKGLPSEADRERFLLARRRIDDCRAVLAQGWMTHSDEAATRDLMAVKRARREA